MRRGEPGESEHQPGAGNYADNEQLTVRKVVMEMSFII